MKKFIILALIACFYNMLVNFRNLSSLVNVYSSYQINFKSFFGNRNQFGGFLFLSNIALTYYYHIKEKKSKILIPLSFVIINVNLLLTMSRSAMLATLVFYFLIVLYYAFKANFKAGIFILLVAIGVFFIINTPSVTNIINKFFIRADAADSGRFGIWKEGISLYLKGNVFLGSGSNYANQLAQSSGIMATQFHNFFIETLIDGGMINLLLVLGSILYVLYKMIFCVSLQFKKIKPIYLFSLMALSIILFVESVNFFGLGLVDTLYGILFISIPLMTVNHR